LSKLRRYLADAGHAFDRAPVEVALAVLGAVTFSYGIETDNAWTDVHHLAVAIVIAASAAWAATITHAAGATTTRTRWIITCAGALIAALYLFLTPDFDLESEKWRAFMLAGASVLMASSAPALVRAEDDPNLRLRRINARVILRAAGIVLYGLALFAGLALALAAINNLFELNLHGEIYGHVFIWIMMVLVPWVIVGGLADYVRPLDEQSDIARVVYRLTTWLVPLLVAIYLLILYVYAVRIFVTGELPKNLVSPMVIAAGLLTLLTLVLFDPPPAASPMRWLRYPVLMYLPLAPLGFWALIIRLDDYGWTEFRMLRLIVLIAVVLLVIAMAIRVLRRAPFTLRVIPVALAVVLVLAAVGPWNVLAVSRRDQQERLVAALTDARVDVRTSPNPADTTTRGLPAEQYNRIEDLSRYLHTHFGADAITDVVPAYQPLFADRYDLPGYFRLRSMWTDSVATQRYARFGGGRPAEMQGVTAYRIEMPGSVPQRPRAWNAGDSLYMIIGTDTLRASLAPAYEQTRDIRRERGAVTATDMTALPVFDRAGTRRGDLVLLEINLTEAKGKRGMPRIDAMLLLEGTR
jgi:hypothetical protein